MKARYYVYRNLHTGTFSLRYKDRVIDHPTEIILKDVHYSVSQSGRQKVRKEKRKNVHATVNGFISDPPLHYYMVGEITYNPYTHEFFEFKGNPIAASDWVLCKNNKIYLIKEL